MSAPHLWRLLNQRSQSWSPVHRSSFASWLLIDGKYADSVSIPWSHGDLICYYCILPCHMVLKLLFCSYTLYWQPLSEAWGMGSENNGRMIDRSLCCHCALCLWMGCVCLCEHFTKYRFLLPALHSSFPSDKWAPWCWMLILAWLVLTGWFRIRIVSPGQWEPDPAALPLHLRGVQYVIHVQPKPA